MKWQQVREQYPDRWLLLEAIGAHAEADKRLVEEVSVVGVYPDSVTAMKGYAQLHRQAPERELYVFHTAREMLDITERRLVGMRGLQSGLECLGG